jgi:hypothetical protein
MHKLCVCGHARKMENFYLLIQVAQHNNHYALKGYVRVRCRMVLSMGAGTASRYSESLGAGQSGDRIPVGGEILLTCPDRPWGPPTMGTRSFSRVNRPGRGVDHPPHLAPRLKKE